MSLRDVMAFIQKRQCASHAGAADTPDHAGAADTPDTPAKTMGYHLKPAWTGACTPDTPDTPVLCETRTLAQTGQWGEASNDANAMDAATPASLPELPDWRTLDKAYLAHHTHCHICQAAGRGARYGLRCGVGAALWTAYDAAANTPGALPWQQHDRGRYGNGDSLGF